MAETKEDVLLGWLKILKGINDLLPGVWALIQNEKIRRNLTDAQLEEFANQTGLKIATLKANIDAFQETLNTQ